MPPSAHPPPPAGFAPDWVERVLAAALASPGRPPVFAITGWQGCGKSTLARQVAQAAARRGISACVLSIDDFYLGRRQRGVLARRVHPLLARRGPPGTHDVELACRILDQLRAWPSPAGVALPRFDKLADSRRPPSRWPRLRQRPQLIVFEGWFLKVPPQAPAQLRAPINALERERDADGSWRAWCNAALAGYAPLWQRLDRLLWLRGPDFAVVPDWRWQQEQALQAARPGRAAMDRAQVADFVQLFERVSRHAQTCLAAIADLTLTLDAQRRPIGWTPP
jgi:D-glycerate 3-kinase